jgi:cation diffusion facilitator family transporter
MTPTPEQLPSKLSELDIQRMRVAMRFSLAIGIFMLFLKMYAYLITGSTAILSDAAESVVHVLAVLFAAYSLRLSLKPADKGHPYGHDRISFFSAGFEGWMIIIAALYIVYEAIHKMMTGLALENLGAGTLFITLSTAINGALGLYLVRQGKKYHSIVLEANGKHVLTDSWTSLGVIVALVLTMITGWLPFDPIIAIFVAVNILWTGGRLVQRSITGLMDQSDPSADEKLQNILERETSKYGIHYHHLRHRNAGNKLLIEFHLLFGDGVTLLQAHEQATTIEQEIHKEFPMQTEIISHLEPIEGHDEIHTRLLNSKKGID